MLINPIISKKALIVKYNKKKHQKYHRKKKCLFSSPGLTRSSFTKMTIDKTKKNEDSATPINQKLIAAVAKPKKYNLNNSVNDLSSSVRNVRPDDVLFTSRKILQHFAFQFTILSKENELSNQCVHCGIEKLCAFPEGLSIEWKCLNYNVLMA